MNKTARKWVTVIIGIILIVFSIRSLREAGEITDFMKTAVETNAVVSDIQTTYDADDGVTYFIYVSFDPDGETEALLEYAQRPSEITLGENRTVYYNPENPWEVIDEDISGRLRVTGFIFAGLGVILVITGALLLLRRRY